MIMISLFSYMNWLTVGINFKSMQGMHDGGDSEILYVMAAGAPADRLRRAPLADGAAASLLCGDGYRPLAAPSRALPAVFRTVSEFRTGLALGSAVVKITRPPDSFRKLVVAAVAFGSS